MVGATYCEWGLPERNPAQRITATRVGLQQGTKRPKGDVDKKYGNVFLTVIRDIQIRLERYETKSAAPKLSFILFRPGKM